MTRLLAFLMIACSSAFSFPTMVSHGYKNCTVCHVNPNGSGILTPYGKGASRDILSDSDSIPQLPLPEWLLVGGDLRVLQTRLATKGFTSKKFTLMQADLEVAVGNEKIKAVGSFGYQNPASQGFDGQELFSRRHYVRYVFSDNLSFSVGRLPIPYGQTTPDHWLIAKSNLGMGEGTESYQVQTHYQTEETQITAYYEKGSRYGARLTASLAEKSYLGFNLRFTDSRQTAGPEIGAAFGGLSAFFNLDADFPAEGPGVFYRTLRLNYELKRGLHLWAVHESTTDSLMVHTFGVNLYPAVHLELSAAIQFSQIQAAWLMGHLWL